MSFDGANIQQFPDIPAVSAEILALRGWEGEKKRAASDCRGFRASQGVCPPVIGASLVLLLQIFVISLAGVQVVVGYRLARAEEAEHDVGHRLLRLFSLGFPDEADKESLDDLSEVQPLRLRIVGSLPVDTAVDCYIHNLAV